MSALAVTPIAPGSLSATPWDQGLPCDEALVCDELLPCDDEALKVIYDTPLSAVPVPITPV